MRAEALAPESLRLFIALGIPEAVKDQLERAQRLFQESSRASTVRWATREQFHLTLRFLGNVEARRLDFLAEALRLACIGFAPLVLRAEGIGFFPERRSPRVIWVAVRDGQEQLPRLQRAIEEATQEFTDERPAPTFTGHVTLGRIRSISRTEAQALAEVSAGMTRRLFGEWTAAKVGLFRSELLPDGARHACLETIPLAGLVRPA